MERIVSAMATRLAHRGLDDSGVWVDADAGVAFGFVGSRLGVLRRIDTSRRRPRVGLAALECVDVPSLARSKPMHQMSHAR